MNIFLGLSPGTTDSVTPFPEASHILPIEPGFLMGVVWEISVEMGVPLLGVPVISLDKIHAPGSKWPKDRLVKGQNHQPHMSCAMYLLFTLYIHILGYGFCKDLIFFWTLKNSGSFPTNTQ